MKGVLDVDTVKGCACGMLAHPCGGCYGHCYASKIATARGFDFSKSVSRQPLDSDLRAIEVCVKNHRANWFRCGTMGDPSHDWPLTLYVCEWLGKLKTPIIVTKHWREIPAAVATRLAAIGVIFNTSTSALDTDGERDYRIGQHYRLKSYGIKSFLRVVTANFGDTQEGRYRRSVQKWIMMHGAIIDTPLRIPMSDARVVDGTILTRMVKDINGMSSVSMWNESIYIGRCENCADQCGATMQN